MASRSPSPLKIPHITRKLSLSSFKRRPSRSMDRSSGSTRVSSADSSFDVDTASAPLPAFLKQSKQAISNTFVDLEWQQRERLAAGLQPSDPPSQWTRTQGAGDVLLRNRYVNIEPFANNRVKLRVQEGGNDYINASPIVLGDKRFISTQGPKDTSVSHFYRMLANETSTVAIVIMLTQTHEAGREKCFQYFPDESTQPIMLQADPEDGEGDGFEGEVRLLDVTEDSPSRSTVRHLKLKTRCRVKDGEGEADWEEKDVYHLLFSVWPDFSVPEGDDRRALLELIALSRKLNAGAPPPAQHSFPQVNNGHSPARDRDQNPRIVHCSAGVGRSGTFIALDHLLTMLEAGELDNVPAGVDPIAETVDILRQQRMMMVQGESQYVFLHEVLRELWLARWREKKV